MSENESIPLELRHPEIIFIPKILLTYQEASQSTGLSVATLESLVSQGKLPVVKIGKSARFRLEDLRSFAEKHLVRKNQ
jgi:excisionase family DNA binding protein